MLAQVYLLFGWKGIWLLLQGTFLRNDVHQLGLEHLEGTALEDVARKTSAANVIREAFSKSTAR